MTEVWITIGLLALGTVALRAAGPVAVGGALPSDRSQAVIKLLAPSLLASLVVYETFIDAHGGITIDSRVIGVAAAAAALVAKLPLMAVIIIAAAVTAGARALGVA
jgi:hypothetical protein